MAVFSTPVTTGPWPALIPAGRLVGDGSLSVTTSHTPASACSALVTIRSNGVIVARKSFQSATTTFSRIADGEYLIVVNNLSNPAYRALYEGTVSGGAPATATEVTGSSGGGGSGSSRAKSFSIIG